VTTGPGGTTTALAFEFSAPVITALAPGTVSVPAAGASGIVITVRGVALGRTAADFVGINASTAIPCSLARWISPTEAHCTLDAAASPIPVGAANLVLETRSGGVAPSFVLNVVAEGSLSVPNVTAAVPMSGPVAGGTTVTIHGTGFGTSSLAEIVDVTLAGVSCRGSTLWSSASLLTCTSMPIAAATTGPIRVSTVAGGDSPVLAAPLFAYTTGASSTPTPPPPPAGGGVVPVVLNIAPAAGPLTGGTDVIISGPALATSTADVVSVTLAGSLCEPVVVNVPAPPSADDGVVTISCKTVGVAVPASGPAVVTSLTAGAVIGMSFTFYDATVVAPNVTALVPAYGPVSGGNTITLHGLGFGVSASDVSSVTFGTSAQATDIAFVSSAQLTCTVPPPPPAAGGGGGGGGGAGAVSVVVTGSGGGAASDPRVYTYFGDPTIESIQPTVLVLATGGWITVTGRHWERVVNVIIEGTSLGLFNTTTLVGARSAFRAPRTIRTAAEVTADDDSSIVRAVSLEVPVPVLKDAGGYHAVRVLNPTRGSGATQGNLLFATDDCPKPGQFGTGKACKDCPEGGICPGGNRIWPKSGYWNPGEDAGYVTACRAPPSRCAGTVDGSGRNLGNATQRCGPGYEGALCATCSVGFTDNNGACSPCPDDASVLAFILADVAMWTTVAIVACTARSSENYQRVVTFISVLQTAGLFSGVLSSDLPAWMLFTYSTFAIFLGDYSIVRSDCLGRRPTFAVSFGLQVAYSFSIGLVTMLACMVVGAIRVAMVRGDPERHAGMRQFYKDRTFRCITVWIQLAYVNLTRRAFEAVNCIPLGNGQLVLAAAPEERCFVGTHIPLFVAGVVLLLTVTIGWPALYTFKIRDQSEDTLTQDPIFDHRWGTHLILLLPSRRFFFIAIYVMMASMAAAEAFTADAAPIVRSIISFSGIGIVILGVILVKPHRSKKDDVLMLMYAAPIMMLIAVSTAKELGNIEPAAEKWTIVSALSVLGICIIINFADMIYYAMIRRTVDYDDLERTTNFLATGSVAKNDDEAAEALDTVGNSEIFDAPRNPVENKYSMGNELPDHVETASEDLGTDNGYRGNAPAMTRAPVHNNEQQQNTTIFGELFAFDFFERMFSNNDRRIPTESYNGETEDGGVGGTQGDESFDNYYARRE
jgi:hypothetical protein